MCIKGQQLPLIFVFTQITKPREFSQDQGVCQMGAIYNTNY